MLIKYIEQKSYCVRRMQKLEKDGLWGPFQYSDLLLMVPVFYTFMAITCIHEFQTQFPTSQIDIYTTAYYIASLIGWVYISLSFFLKKIMYLVEGGRRKFHNAQLRTVDNSGHQDWQQGLSINELSLWLCIPVLTLLSFWWRHIW